MDDWQERVHLHVDVADHQAVALVFTALVSDPDSGVAQLTLASGYSLQGSQRLVLPVGRRLVRPLTELVLSHGWRLVRLSREQFPELDEVYELVAEPAARVVG